MLWLVAIIVISTQLFQGCVAKTVPAPTPLDGVDMYDGKTIGDVCFSQMYLENYLQWKHDNCMR